MRPQSCSSLRTDRLMRASKMLNLYKPDRLRQSAQSEVQKQEKKDNCTESCFMIGRLIKCF